MENLTKNLWIGIAAGLFASWVKSVAEPPLQKIGERKFLPKPNQRLLKGADVNFHPENMPPAVLAQEIYHETTGSELSKQETLQAMTLIHYALGTVVGVVYVTLVNENKKLQIEQGITAGAVVWALTHGSTVPALGLQGKVSEMPKSWWVWEFGSHLVFGVALEQSRKILNKILK